MQIDRLLTPFCALIALGACSDDGIGGPCAPTIPCGIDGTHCGFHVAETYVSTNVASCSAGQACLVYHLDNGTDGGLRADPRVPCTSPGTPEGCVSAEAIERSIYCSCPCGREGSDDRSGLCTCGDGYQCSPVAGAPEWYCVRRPVE